MKEKRFVGIDNGKQGAVAVIDMERNILETFKYEENNPCFLYDKLKKYIEDYEVYAFVEQPIVVYGLAHQTAPFETIGRHKMTLEILKIPYRLGNPAAHASDNWKRIIGLYEDADIAANKNRKEITSINKQAKEIKIKAELLGYGERELKTDKLAYMPAELLPLATEYRELKKKVDRLKGDKKQNVKDTSIKACLEFFPEAAKHIEKQSKTSRILRKKYDDDTAEAILLAECGRTLHINGNF